jgi:hypothetical protein
MKPRLVAALVLLGGTPALSHRLDEYLQGVLISIGKDRVQAQITLTPGVAVFPFVLAGIDADGDGLLSEAEQRAYAAKVLGDLSLAVDGHPLAAQLISRQFPTFDEMKEGRGQIQIEFQADLPSGGPNRRLTFENRHHSGIAAYQVNCLVPRDPDIRVVAQRRNDSQSIYQLDYVQAGVRSDSSFAWGPADRVSLCMIALVLLARFALLLWRRRAHGARNSLRASLLN